MENVKSKTSAKQQYDIAYKEHYEKKDLQRAMNLYNGVITDFPDDKESGYSKSQIRNIANEVIPEKELRDSQLELLAKFYKNNEKEIGGLKSLVAL